jgi:hypothetical protein
MGDPKAGTEAAAPLAAAALAEDGGWRVSCLARNDRRSGEESRKSAVAARRRGKAGPGQITHAERPQAGALLWEGMVAADSAGTTVRRRPRRTNINRYANMCHCNKYGSRATALRRANWVERGWSAFERPAIDGDGAIFDDVASTQTIYRRALFQPARNAPIL